jgi:hypothetical protein
MPTEQELTDMMKFNQEVVKVVLTRPWEKPFRAAPYP